MNKEIPVNYKIWIKPLLIKAETESGMTLYPTDDALEVAQRGVDVGEVLAIGEQAFMLDRFGNKCPIKEGDIVRFVRFAGHMYRDMDEAGRPKSKDWFLYCNDEHILGIVERKK